MTINSGPPIKGLESGDPPLPPFLVGPKPDETIHLIVHRRARSEPAPPPPTMFQRAIGFVRRTLKRIKWP